MDIPYIRAKANDNAEELDNLLSSFEAPEVAEIVDYVLLTHREIEQVLTHAVENGLDPVEAYRTFVSKVREYAPASYFA
jgi:hypothetical protein